MNIVPFSGAESLREVTDFPRQQGLDRSAAAGADEGGPVRHIAIEPDQRAALREDEMSDLDLGDLVGQLRDLSAKLANALKPQDPNHHDGEVVYSLVKDILRFRRLRNRLLGADLFGEPAWEILLELFAANWSGERLSVSGACYVSGVPSSTALRWIVRLERDGWIERVDDPLDRRRSWLRLTDGAEKRLREFITQMAIGFAQAAQCPLC
jgi:DNA-binding MarR family transcriptional regulator